MARDIRKGKNTVEIIRRDLTPAERTRLEASRAEVEANIESYKEEGRRRKRASEAKRSTAVAHIGGELNEVMKALRAERDRQGVSLTDLTERTGIAGCDLSALENEDDPDATLATVNRIAEALGVRVAVQLVPITAK